jgi:hypothetical protein
MKDLMVRTHTFTMLTARLVAIVVFAVLLSAVPFHAALAAAPDLGTAGSFAVLGGSAVTCTDSTITGDVGVYPGTTVTQTNCTINGRIHAGDASAFAAYSDFLTAYAALALKPCDQPPLTGNLSGVTLTPGVYCFDAAATLTGQLTLDGPADGIWIFKIGTLGTGALTGTNFSVVMANGGQPCNVYWWVAEAATMTTSNFQGTILAGAATTFTGGSLIGRDLAKAAVTMTGASVIGCGSLAPIGKDQCKQYCKDYCKDYDKDHWKDYWKEYWKDSGKYHCKDHEKDYCKNHHCQDHDKNRCNYHDNDHRGGR